MAPVQNTSKHTNFNSDTNANLNTNTHAASTTANDTNAKRNDRQRTVYRKCEF